MSEQFYLRVRGKVAGPYDRNQVTGLIDRGKFGRQHEISEDGITWSRAANYPALFERGTQKKRRSAPVGESSLSPLTETEPSAVPADEFGSTIGLARDPGTSSSRASITSTSPDNQTWHYATEAGEFGPVPFAVVRQMVGSGDVRFDDQVWCSSWPDWRLVQDVPELTSGLGTGRKPRKSTTSDASSFDVPNASLFSLLFGLYALSGVFGSLYAAGVTFVVALIPSITLGHLALRIHRDHPTIPGRPYAMSGLIISYGIICLAIVVFALVLFGVRLYNDINAPLLSLSSSIWR